MATEIELKLRIAARDLPRVRRHALFRSARRLRSQKLYSVYYDTPDLDLWRSRVTLRLRQVGAHWVQTVKGGGSVTAGLHRREESEAKVVGPLPDFTALDGTAMAGHFAAAQLRAQLRPVIVMEFTRARAVIESAGGARIEASIDRGLIKSGDATDPLSEIELEVLAGEPWRAYEVALKLVAGVPLLVENRSKAERGFALHQKAVPEPVRAAPSRVTESMSAEEAFISLVDACLAQFVANQAGMLAGRDPEFLHQMRVALRRLRSVFGTFEPLFPEAALVTPVAETRWLAQALGPARDWDVFHTETLPPINSRYPQHPGIAAITKAAVQRRRSANRGARAAVASARGQGLLLALGGWLAARTWLEAMTDAGREAMKRPIGEFARTVLETAHARVLKRGRGFGKLTPEQLHRLRIAAKKLRYAVEFFGPLYHDEVVRAYRALLVALQDELGRFNDAGVVARLVAEAGPRLEGAAGAEARGILLGWSGGAQTFGSQKLRQAWKGFRDGKSFWQ